MLLHLTQSHCVFRTGGGCILHSEGHPTGVICSATVRCICSVYLTAHTSLRIPSRRFACRTARASRNSPQQLGVKEPHHSPQQPHCNPPTLTSRNKVSCGLILWKTTFWMEDFPERRAPMSSTRGLSAMASQLGAWLRFVGEERRRPSAQGTARARYLPMFCPVSRALSCLGRLHISILLCLFPSSVRVFGRLHRSAAKTSEDLGRARATGRGVQVVCAALVCGVVCEVYAVRGVR